MELVREICRLKWSEKKSDRIIGEILKVSKTTVKTHFERVRGAGITSWEQLEAVDDDDLKKMVFPRKSSRDGRPIDFARISKELKRKNMTLMLLWEEAGGKGSGLPGYSRFCGLYREWKKGQKITMRQACRISCNGYHQFPVNGYHQYPGNGYHPKVEIVSLI